MYRLKTLFVLSLAALPLAAQMDRAVLTGTVLDPSKSVVPGAKVSAHTRPLPASTTPRYPIRPAFIL